MNTPSHTISCTSKKAAGGDLTSPPAVYTYFYSVYGSMLLTCATGEKSLIGQFTIYKPSNVVVFLRAERSVIGLSFNFKRSIFGRVPSGLISLILFPDKLRSVTFRKSGNIG